MKCLLIAHFGGTPFDGSTGSSFSHPCDRPTFLLSALRKPLLVAGGMASAQADMVDPLNGAQPSDTPFDGSTASSFNQPRDRLTSLLSA